MHEYVQMPAFASALYIAYCVVCAAYAAFALAASLFSAGHRQRIHRGTWLHVAEGWALAAVLWAACAWARHTLRTEDGAWSGVPPLPRTMGVATVALLVLLPPALMAVVVMTITTIVRAWPPPSALKSRIPESRKET
jgi:hypothetical protein